MTAPSLVVSLELVVSRQKIKSTNYELPTNNSLGFTLIELLVVISIIAILSAVGFVSYQGVRGKALEAKRKADIDSIKKAYETKYDPTAINGQGGYKPLADSDFTSGKIPTPDGTTDTSYIIQGPYISSSNPNPSPAPNFAACAPLKEGVSCPSSNAGDCSCVTSTQGESVDLKTLSCRGDGLIGNWRFDEGSGQALDSSSNKLVTSGSPASWVSSKVGKYAGRFNGSSIATATFPDTASSNSGVYIPQGNSTFAMWFKTTSPSGGLQMIGGNGCDRIIWLSNGILNFNSWAEVNFSGTTRVNDGNWHHLAYVLDKTNGFKAYIDGQIYATSTAQTQCGTGCSGFNWANQYIIGSGGYCRGGGDGGAFSGDIDDVRIYNKPLSAAEVGELLKCR